MEIKELVELEMIDQLAAKRVGVTTNIVYKIYILAEIIKWLTPCLVVLLKVSLSELVS